MADHPGKTEQITVSVRSLVEFLLRTGDLDRESGGMSDESVMLAGAAMHRKIQKEAGGDYEAEVPLEILWKYAGAQEGGTVLVQGRADGIFTGKKGNRTVDEIKTTYRRLEHMKEPDPVHLAQAKCYAFILASQENLPGVTVRMTYVSLATGKIRYFYEDETMDGLSAWFSSLMEQYRRWAQLTAQLLRKRDASIRTMTFPYSYREGQKKLIAAVYATIKSRRKLFLEAPTGTGKTLAVLYPSLKAMGEGMCSRIFYLTAKNVTGEAAAQTMALLEKGGLAAKTLALQAREKTCIKETPECTPEKCGRAKGHFDRVNDALYDLVTGENLITSEIISRYAEKHQVCPFELSLDASLFADLVIGDYNYLFDPHASLKRFFSDTAPAGEYVFLVDEAHNLESRGRDMYSAELERGQVLSFRKKIRGIYPTLEKPLTKVSGTLLAIKKQGEESGILPDADRLTDAAGILQQKMEEIFQKEREDRGAGRDLKDPLREKKQGIRQDVMNFYFLLSHFNLIAEKLDDHYRIYYENGERGQFTVRLFCVDPSANLKACLDRGRSSILFSATFLPIQYYKALLGGTKEDYEIYAHSVFDPERRGLFIVKDVTSRYRMRGPQEYAKIAGAIRSITGARHGNYMVFFPSYKFMDGVWECFERLYYPQNGEDHNSQLLPKQKEQKGTDENNDRKGHRPDTLVPPEEITVLLQRPGMSGEERKSFLEAFSTPHTDRCVIGFCVLGGMFGEGIDLRRDSLIGAVIVGTGVPMVSTEREIIREYFDRRGEDGYSYAYTYPGMNKVLQAAGRVIRTQEDVGIVALLDDRFITPGYRRLFPAEWTDVQETASASVSGLVERFWNEWL